MRRNTTQPEDAAIHEALNFSGISDLIDIIDRFDGELDSLGEENTKLNDIIDRLDGELGSLGEENTKLNDRIESLETLLTEKDSIIRDLESQSEST